MTSPKATTHDAAFEQIDRIIAGVGRIERRVSDYILALQRELSPESSITLEVAEQLSLLSGRVAYLFTGFVVPSRYPKGENGGPLGALALARALRSAGLRPTLWVDPQLVDTALWLAAELAVTIPVQAIDLAELEKRRSEPAVAIAIEKPGNNNQGIMHTFDGLAISSGSLSIDALFLHWNASQTLTMAIGDRGNEIGFGALSEPIARWAPSSLTCQCGCGGGVVASTPAQRVLPAAVSNWGAYGIAAALALLAGDTTGLLEPAEEERMLRVAAVRGCVDGICRRGCYGVDGLPGMTSVAVVQALKDTVLDALRG